MIKAIIFDLDNTLYDQRLYNFGAFKDISSHVEKKYDVERKIVYDKLIEAWENNPNSPNLFDIVLRQLGIVDADIEELVIIFHSHDPELKLYTEAKKTLLKLKEKYKLGLLTDGTPEKQKRKVVSLGIEKMFDCIVFTAEGGKEYSKPHSSSYETIVEKLRVVPDEAVYVGDNPNVDFVSAKKLGMKTIRILKGPFKNVDVQKEFDGDYKIKTLDEVFIVLRRLVD